MRILILLGITLLLSCHNEIIKHENGTELKNKHSSTKEEIIEAKQYQECWKGKLNSKINILLHYQLQEDIITGQLFYLDQKNQKPIRIIGTIEEDRYFRLLEFDKTGNITGVIKCLPNEQDFNGTWFSPKTRKEFRISMKKIDTLIDLENIKTDIENVVGNYYYQYNESVYQGNLTIEKVNKNNISLRIFSVTGEPGGNMADIETDTIQTKTDFIYKVPYTDSCEFRMRFFKDFAYINYTKGYCTGIFGLNATVDGIFYKQK
jgi:hypothetical protein